MKFYKTTNATIALVCLALSLMPSHCASAASEIVDEKASLLSTLEAISAKENKKSEIARKLPKKLGGMALFKVLDYQKRILVGRDFGYAIFYDLKGGKAGSGNIYLYTRDGKDKVNGLTEEALTELLIEQRDVEKADVQKGIEKQVTMNSIPFYRTEFLTPPDAKNDAYICHLLITTYNNVYVKLMFFYPQGAAYANSETEKFLRALTTALKS